MNKRTIVAGVLMASLSIAVPGTVFSQQHGFLKSGGVDDADVAIEYYNTIDPYEERTTQADWLEVNGYNDSVNKEIDVRGHFSDGDLAFWRSITLVKDKRDGYKGNIAFTTANYNTEKDALNGTNPLSIVNMEYSPGPEGDPITKFYVFDVDTGERVTSTVFDNSGEQLHLPAACFSCHGGDDDAEAPLPNGYNDGSGETNATFLAFDIRTMKFGTTTQADLEAGIKKLNKAVLRTDPTKATRKLIKGLYGGAGLSRNTQDLTYIPASWEDESELYYKVIVPTCQGCHATSDTKLLSLQWWKANAASIREVVFHEELMPDSMPAYERFWNKTDQHKIVLDALDRFELP